MRVEVRKWRHLDDLAKPWSGAWIAVFDASVPRSDRAALRRHERAMRLRALGLHPAALVVGLDDLDEESRVKATGLWDTTTMLARYRALTDELVASKAKLERLPLETAAAESMVLGRDVIRHINLDPVLPEELMPGRALATLIRTMSDYDEQARALWRCFMRAHAPRD